MYNMHRMKLPKVKPGRQIGLFRRAPKQFVAALLILVMAGAISAQIIRTANRSLIYAPKSLAECQQAATKDYQCYAKYYADLDYRQGDKAALDDMTAAYKTDEFIVAECHQ